MENRITFRWASSYRGEVEYQVHDETGAYRATLLRTAEHFPASEYNGTAAEWQRDVAGKVGLLHRSHNIQAPIPPATLEAFNAWRAYEHFRELERIRAEPHRYGEIAPNDPILTPPPPARAAVYEIGRGWVVTAEPRANAA